MANGTANSAVNCTVNGDENDAADGTVNRLTGQTVPLTARSVVQETVRHHRQVR